MQLDQNIIEVDDEDEEDDATEVMDHVNQDDSEDECEQVTARISGSKTQHKKARS